jgi:hypothetical protein
VAAGVLLEHPYAAGRDALDLITSLGASHALTSTLWLGVEAVGSDLEGFWDSAEAGGGATLVVMAEQLGAGGLGAAPPAARPIGAPP